MHKPIKYFIIRPHYWPRLLLFSFAWVLGHLPVKIHVMLANLIAWSMLRFGKRRRNIAKINLELCFPDYSESEREVLLKQNFKATALGLIETTACWFTDLESRSDNSLVVGQQNLDKALKKGKGVILLSFHLTSLEPGGCIACQRFPIWPMYKPNKDPLIESIMCQGRLRHVENLIQQNDIRSTVKALKQNKIVWYATDQNYGTKSAVFVPFFGIMASTITATTKFAKLTGASVVPFTQKRIDNGKGYRLEFHPALENFPGVNEIEDATRINRYLERYLIKNPVDYLWLHQRFRTRPEGEPKIYPPRK